MLREIDMENEELWDDVSDEELLKADLNAATGTPISRMWSLAALGDNMQ